MNNENADRRIAPRSRKLLEFEVLRAVSILLLFVVHSEVQSRPINGVSWEPVGPFIGAFFLGAFFFMAGYFADASFRRREKSIVPFFKSKLIRIYPPYLIALLLFVLILEYTLKRRDWIVYLLNIQFIFSPLYAKQLLTLWYVSVLIAYYVIFASAFVHTLSGKSLFLTALTIFSLAYIINRMTGLVDGRFLEYLFVFTAGIYFSRNAKVFEWFFSINFLFVFIFAVIGTFLFWFVQTVEYEFVSWQYFVAVDIFMIGWVLLALRVFRSSISDWGIWRPISYASFFAYLYHRPFWELITNFQWGALSTDVVWVRLLPGSIIVLVVCYYLQRAYDQLIDIFGLTS